MLSFRFVVFDKRFLETRIARHMKDHDAFRLHEPGDRPAAILPKVLDDTCNIEIIEVATPQNRHQADTWRKDILQLDHPGIFHRNLLRSLTRQTPALHIEKTQPFVVASKTIPALNPAAPPLAEMASRSEGQQFVFVIMRPTAETIVVIVWRDPAGTGTGEELAIFADVDTTVGTVDFLCDDNVPGVPGDLGERDEFGHIPLLYGFGLRGIGCHG